MPQLDPASYPSQLFWLAVCFGLFYFLMAKFAIPAISNVLERRSNQITRDLEKAESLKTDLETAISSYEKAIVEARQKAQGIVAETQAKVKAETEKEQQAVEEQIAAKSSEAEARVQAAREAAMSELGNIASSVSGDILKNFTGSEVDAGKLKASVDSIIANRNS